MVSLLLQRSSLGEHIARRPAWLEGVVCSVLYWAGVVLALLLEQSSEVRHENGRMPHALAGILGHEDIDSRNAGEACRCHAEL
jgi:hypothetical protein